MVSFMTLAKAINESAGGYVSANIPAHKFMTESVIDAIGQATQEIVTEAAATHEFYVSGTEVLVEAAINDPSSIQIIHEGFFSALKDKVVAFFKKIIEMVKGLIEKLKAAIYKMTGRTDKWLTVMRPKIKAAQGKSGSSKFKTEMYAYDINYITKDLPAVFSKFEGDWLEDSGINEIKAKSGKVDASLKTMMTDRKKHDAAEAGSYAKANEGGADGEEDDQVKSYVEFLEKEAENWKEETEAWRSDFPGTIAGYVGVSASSLEQVQSEIAKKARGSEKKEVTVGGQVDAMLKAIETSKDSIDTIKKNYDKHLKSLEKAKADLESSGRDLDIKPDPKDGVVPGSVSSAARNAYGAMYDHMMTVTSAYENELGKIRQLNISLVNSMAGDFMTALSRFAGYKEEKAS